MLNRDDEGALAIVVALFAVMLFTLSALVVEAGTQRESRRDAQNAADAGALAAAGVLAQDGTRTAAVNVAAEYGVANNFPRGRTVANYFSGCTARVPSGWQRSARTSCVSFKPDGAGRWSAVQVVTPQVQTPKLFGATGGPTRALAQASVLPGADISPPVIFGGSTTCTDTVRWARISATGDIHSNNGIRVGTGTVTGDGTYRGSVTGGGTTWVPGPPDNPTDVGGDEDTPRAYPKTFNMADFRAGGSWRSDPNFHMRSGNGTINNTWLSNPSRDYLDDSSDVLDPGIYYTGGNITLTGDMTSSGATFVSDGGQITFSGGGTKSFLPYVPDLQAFSTEAGCTTDAVDISSNSNRVTFGGVIYAPSGRIRIRNSASLTTSSGSIEGLTVQGFDTSLVTLNSLPATITGPPTLRLQAPEE